MNHLSVPPSRPPRLLPLLLGAAGLLAAGHIAQAETYNGNGANGFGGGVGGGILTITNGTGGAINFSLATSGFNGNGLAIYLDTRTGGVNNTSTFTDTADSSRVVLSGLSGSGRTLATFAPGFNADFGIALLPGNFAGLYNLSTPANFGFVASAGLNSAATTTLNFSVNRADIGLPATGGGFTFAASLISTTGYRANETIGTSVTTVDPANVGTAPNAGFTGTQTFAASNTFGTPAPEPSTWALLAAGAGVLGAGLLRRRAAQA